MRDDKKLLQDIYNKFLEAHPEIRGVYTDAFYNAMIQHARSYAAVAVEFTVIQMREEFAMEKKESV